MVLIRVAEFRHHTGAGRSLSALKLGVSERNFRVNGEPK